MSLGVRTTQAVQKEAAMKRPYPLCAKAHEMLLHRRKSREAQAAVRLADSDRFSHMAEEVTVLVPGTGQEPKRVAERFAGRATYLSEALRFVECASDGAAIVRSTPETMRGKRAPYFEARIAANEITLRRFQPHPTKPGREPIPFCITGEILTRLVDDAVQSLTGK